MHNLKKVIPCAYVTAIAMGSSAEIVEGSRPVLEEILVTAQKRVQSMQDVPATISAIGEQELRDSGLFDIRSVGAARARHLF